MENLHPCIIIKNMACQLTVMVINGVYFSTGKRVKKRSKSNLIIYHYLSYRVYKIWILGT